MNGTCALCAPRSRVAGVGCFDVSSFLAARLPAVAVLANGGMISKKELLNCVRHGIPVIVIEGSGRLADQVQQAWGAWMMGTARTSVVSL